MRSRSDQQVIGIMREQYESRIYRVLIESSLKGGQIMGAAGLEVTRKRDGKGGVKGEKYTIHSVEKRGGEVIVKLVSPENVSAPVPGQPLSPSQPTQEYTLEEFEDNFDV